MLVSLIFSFEALLVRLLVRFRSYRLLAWLLSRRAVRELLPDGSSVPFRPRVKDGRPTIFVLHGDRMPDDLRVLCRSEEIRILEIIEPWLGRIAYQFLPMGLGFGAYVSEEPRADILRGREKFRPFLKMFLRHFYRYVPVDCVVRTDFKLQTDFDWAFVSYQLGKPYVILQRENMIGHAPAIVGGQFIRDLDIGRFEGTHIIVYNQHSKDRYLRAGTASPDRISVLGCLRMDELIARTKRRPVAATKKRITLFAIHPWMMQVVGSEADQMYRDVHVIIAKFARANPDVDVVVKLKKKDAEQEYDVKVKQVLAAEGIDADEIPNMSFTAKGPAHDHIFASDLVIGLNSTTILESAISGLPVIVPFFDSMQQPKYQDQLKFGADLDIFDVAHDRDHLVALINECLRRPAPDERMMERRWQVFEKHFHSRDGKARERVVAKLLETIHCESAAENEACDTLADAAE